MSVNCAEEPSPGVAGESSLEAIAAACIGVSGMFSYPESELPDLAFLDHGLPGWKKFDAVLPLKTLQVEYTRLFINTLPEVPCPPYGSVYLDGCCMSGSTVAVQAIYRRAGIESDEIADHLAVELEFLGLAIPRLSAYSEEQRLDIIEIIRHLSSWTQEFFNRVQKHDRSGFYRYAAETGTELVRRLGDIGPLLHGENMMTGK